MSCNNNRRLERTAGLISSMIYRYSHSILNMFTYTALSLTKKWLLLLCNLVSYMRQIYLCWIVLIVLILLVLNLILLTSIICCINDFCTQVRVFLYLSNSSQLLFSRNSLKRPWTNFLAGTDTVIRKNLDRRNVADLILVAIVQNQTLQNTQVW